MTNEQRVALWDAINRYAQTCGGDPSKHVYGNTPRMDAVADVERVVRDVESEAAQPGPHPDQVIGSGFCPGPGTDPWDL